MLWGCYLAVLVRRAGDADVVHNFTAQGIGNVAWALAPDSPVPTPIVLRGVYPPPGAWPGPG